MLNVLTFVLYSNDFTNFISCINNDLIMKQILNTIHEILLQLKELSEQLSDDQYSRPLPVLMNNSMGKHYRHVIEFIDLLTSSGESGVVEYDKRKHDVVLETSRTRMAEKISELQERLNKITSDRQMLLRLSYDHDTDEQIEINTCLERELVYNIEHAIHHMAIIRIALIQEFPDIQVGSNFGIAYSTIKFQKK